MQKCKLASRLLFRIKSSFLRNHEITFKKEIFYLIILAQTDQASKIRAIKVQYFGCENTGEGKRLNLQPIIILLSRISSTLSTRSSLISSSWELTFTHNCFYCIIEEHIGNCIVLWENIGGQRKLRVETWTTWHYIWERLVETNTWWTALFVLHITSPPPPPLTKKLCKCTKLPWYHNLVTVM